MLPALCHDLRADAGVRENLEEQGVRRAAVDEVDFLHALRERVQGALHFRDHAAGDDLVLAQLLDLLAVDAKG